MGKWEVVEERGVESRVLGGVECMECMGLRTGCCS